MKMFVMKSVAAIGIVALMAVAGRAQPPAVTFPLPAGSAGAQIPLSTPSNENPVDVGHTGFNFGWTYDSYQGYNAGGANALIRMAPSAGGTGLANHAAMTEADPWVLHMEFRVQGAYPAGDFFMFSKHSPPDIGAAGDGREDRMFAISHGGNANSWSILSRTEPNWVTVASGLSMVNEEYVDFDVHYVPGDGFDFYWENVLVADNVVPSHGRFDMDFWQIEEVASANTSIRNVRLGIVPIPEPSSLTLLIGSMLCIVAVRRKK